MGYSKAFGRSRASYKFCSTPDGLPPKLGSIALRVAWSTYDEERGFTERIGSRLRILGSIIKSTHSEFSEDCLEDYEPSIQDTRFYASQAVDDEDLVTLLASVRQETMMYSPTETDMAVRDDDLQGYCERPY